MLKQLLVLTVMFLAFAVPTAAQDEDKSGTNPINFTWDWRTYMEMINLEGDHSVTVQTIEQRIPLGKKMNFRYKVKHVAISTAPDSTGLSREYSGLGDWSARVLYVPFANTKRALAFGLEGTFDTASNDFLGLGKTTLGPQVFGVFFKPPGGGVLVAPAYQYVFDIAGDDNRMDISQSKFDLFYLWLDKNKKWWALANPQAVIDHERETDFGLFEMEAGRMILGGISSYVRASAGIGADRPYELSGEFGFKAIYR
jgi:hypothetical protein